jgi:hypothetical protein
MEQTNILVFRTSIRKKQEIRRIATILNTYPQIKQWNLDFEDWEKVLKIECVAMDPEEISKALRTVNVWISELE